MFHLPGLPIDFGKFLSTVLHIQELPLSNVNPDKSQILGLIAQYMVKKNYYV